MAEKKLMKGNEAFAAAAINAGCRYYFGYPITPQSEVPEYMSRELKKAGGAFIQPSLSWAPLTWHTAHPLPAAACSSLLLLPVSP